MNAYASRDIQSGADLIQHMDVREGREMDDSAGRHGNLSVGVTQSQQSVKKRVTYEAQLNRMSQSTQPTAHWRNGFVLGGVVVDGWVAARQTKKTVALARDKQITNARGATDSSQPIPKPAPVKQIYLSWAACSRRYGCHQRQRES
jgi:hypothetical protein